MCCSAQGSLAQIPMLGQAHPKLAPSKHAKFRAYVSNPPPYQLSSHTRTPLNWHLLARLPSRQCHFVFRVMRNNDVWILSLDGDKDCHINWRRAKVTSTTITHNNNIDFGLIVSRVKDLLKRQTYFMFRLGFEKAVFGFVQNLVVEALECFGMLIFKCFRVLASSNFRKVW